MPPSGPMDSLSFRFGNALVGNAEAAAGLELTMAGPSLRFHSPAVVALTGAAFAATLDGGAGALLGELRRAAGRHAGDRHGATSACPGVLWIPSLNRVPVPFSESFAVPRGATLAIGTVRPSLVGLPWSPVAPDSVPVLSLERAIGTYGRAHVHMHGPGLQES